MPITKAVVQLPSAIGSNGEVFYIVGSSNPRGGGEVTKIEEIPGETINDNTVSTTGRVTETSLHNTYNGVTKTEGYDTWNGGSSGTSKNDYALSAKASGTDKTTLPYLKITLKDGTFIKYVNTPYHVYESAPPTIA